MVSACLELLSLGMCVCGTLLGMVACGLPTWKVSAFSEKSIVISQSIHDGLWMSCVVQSTGQMQCQMYDSWAALEPDLQVARVLTVISSVIGMVGLIVTLVGAQCTNCVKTRTVKTRIVKAGGGIYIISGLVILVPLCWMAINVRRHFYNPHIPDPMKREIGDAIYIGWAAAGLLLLGGTVLCLPCRASARSSYSIQYASMRSGTVTLNNE
ncbi:claudin-4-like [Megalops cyprinoides]|uniref:claudin-4-like n=1 Tax=Megalops cyprinoides TaxID=118141 RepID=UPI0018647120|nr:claudin-4-like [Megalops cyprinoides]